LSKVETMALSERLFAAGLEQLSGSVVQIRADATSRLDQMEQRLAGAEKAARFNTDVLDHTLEKLEASANQRAMDQVDYHRRAAHAEQRFNRLEDSLTRLKIVEEAMGDAVSQMKRNDTAAHLGAALQAVAHRLESLEQDHQALLDQLRARPLDPVARPVSEPPPFVETPQAGFDIPSESGPVEYSTEAAPDFEEIFLAAPEDGAENFLTRARRSARVTPAKPRPRYLFAVLVALVMALAVAAGLALSGQMEKKTTLPPATGPAMRTFSLPEPPDEVGDDTQFVVAPQVGALSRGEAARNAPSRDRLAQMAASGDPAALTALGLRAADGSKFQDAIKLLTQAAEKGQAVAQYRLGTMYEHAQGVAADAVKAAHWYELAASQGNRKAMHNLAVFFAGGAAGKKNMPEAARWFAKAAALGLSDSQFNLAVLYERGDGVPQSLVDAYKWYSIAAAAGDSESRTRLMALQTQLGDIDKAVAGKSAASFHAAPLDHTANVPPDPMRG
jgi:hypothetical protein